MEAVALDGVNYVQHIAYNAKGQRVLIAYVNAVMTRYAYDTLTFRLGRLRTERYDNPNDLTYRPNSGLLQDCTYEYDLAGNISRIMDRVPGSGFVNNSDPQIADPQLRSLSVRGDALVRRFEYDPLYRLTRATGRESKNIAIPRPRTDDTRDGFNSGNHGTANQDNAPNLTSGYWETYAYDPAGNIVEISHGPNGTAAWARHFGMGGRTPQQWDRDWRTHLNDPAGWAGAPDNQLTHVGDNQINFPATHQFDANGNMTQENTERHFSWDHTDRMVLFRVQAGNVPSVEARYLYGADGMRVKKWLRKNGNGNNDESAIYIGGFFEYHQWTESGTSKQNNYLHVCDNNSGIAIVRVGDKHRDDGGKKVRYQLGDHLGGSAIIVGGENSTANNFINREEYYPYGETSFGSFGKKRYRYSGKERDEESGLYYFGGRFYSAAIGSWLSADPIGPRRHLNSYQAFLNNPLRYGDPFGLAESSTTAPPKVTGDATEGVTINGWISERNWTHLKGPVADKEKAETQFKKAGSAELDAIVLSEIEGGTFKGGLISKDPGPLKDVERFIRIERSAQVGAWIKRGWIPQEFELLLDHVDTKNDLAAGKAFRDTKIGRHMSDVFSPSGYGIDWSSVKIRRSAGGDVTVAGKFFAFERGNPVAAFSRDFWKSGGGKLNASSVGLGLITGGIGLYSSYVAIDEAYYSSGGSEAATREGVRQGTGWAASIFAGGAIGTAVGGLEGTLAGLVVGGVAGTFGYNVADVALDPERRGPGLVGAYVGGVLFPLGGSSMGFVMGGLLAK